MDIWYLFGLDDSDRSAKTFFFATLSFVLLMAIVGFVNYRLLNTILTDAFDWVLKYFGWWFMLLGFALFVFAIFVTFSKYGNVKIGGPNAEPKFDKFSWMAMIFTVGFSGSLIIWGIGEPLQIVNNPPPSPPIPGVSTKTLSLSFMYLHEVLPAGAMWYFPFSVAFGIIAYTRGIEKFRFSSMLDVIFSDLNPIIRWTIDLASLIAIIGGVASVVGFSAQTYSAILRKVYGLNGRWFVYLLFIIIGALFLFDVWLGLRKGIQNASRITVVMGLIAFVVVLALGPTLYILKMGINAGGVWINNILRLSLYTGSMANGGDWAFAWTGFWWAWWAAWGLFVGSFTARVSKGRSIRDIFFYMVLIPAIILWMLHTVIGGWVLSPEYVGPLTDAVANGIPVAVGEAVRIIPHGKLLGVLFVLVIAGFLLTSLDSAVYILSSLTLGDDTPNARNRAWWGIMLAIFGVMSINLPVFEALQALPVVLALPFTVFIVAIIIASYIALKEHYTKYTDDSIYINGTRRSDLYQTVEDNKGEVTRSLDTDSDDD